MVNVNQTKQKKDHPLTKSIINSSTFMGKRERERERERERSGEYKSKKLRMNKSKPIKGDQSFSRMMPTYIEARGSIAKFVAPKNT